MFWDTGSAQVHAEPSEEAEKIVDAVAIHGQTADECAAVPVLDLAEEHSEPAQQA